MGEDIRLAEALASWVWPAEDLEGVVAAIEDRDVYLYAPTIGGGAA